MGMGEMENCEGKHRTCFGQEMQAQGERPGLSFVVAGLFEAGTESYHCRHDPRWSE
jgi:hypothetical protein